jgi:hypothetical protein
MASGGHRVNVVLTAYLTGRPDPQRGTMWPADREALKPLLDSIPGSVVVFANELQGEAVEPVEAPTSVYFDRWRHYAAYLEAHEEIGFAFCVDATDVLMLRDPFPHMHPGTLYCGSEPLTIGESAWMWQHHEPLRDWMAANAGRVLLNPGLVGGDRATVLRLCERMAAEQRGMVMDEGPFNLIAYEEFPGFVTGPLVHTLYKAEETCSAAWFKHK